MAVTIAWNEIALRLAMTPTIASRHDVTFFHDFTIVARLLKKLGK